MGNLAKMLVIALVALFVFSLVTLHLTGVKADSNKRKTIIVPDDYPTVNGALANAAEGDTIFVKKGRCEEETLKINKTPLS